MHHLAESAGRRAGIAAALVDLAEHRLCSADVLRDQAAASASAWLDHTEPFSAAAGTVHAAYVTAYQAGYVWTWRLEHHR